VVLLIDNYDSFVFNLARYIAELGIETRVVRNDAVTLDEIATLAPAAIVLSPGPCTPREAGVCSDLIRTLGATQPVLGVCLGHQVIADALHGRVEESPWPTHGRASLVHHAETGLFEGLPNPLRVARYHSLIVQPQNLPDELEITAWTEDGVVMGLRHRHRPLHGVQFHPESVLTEHGHLLLANFLRIAGLSPGPIPAGDLPQSLPAADFYALPIDPAGGPVV
jgi:anthranilate synthase/aminodeoxychorismate synthase-like glutamine amidotransferase